MIQMFTTKKCRPTPLGSYRANVRNPARTLFIYMIVMFITEKCRPIPPGSYKTNTQNRLGNQFIDIIKILFMENTYINHQGPIRPILKIQ